MDFLNHREGGKVFSIRFSLFPLQCTVTELWSFKKQKSQGKAVEVTVFSKEETL
jgi:hypothetical protein